MKGFQLLAILLMFFSVNLFAEPLQESFPPPGNINMTQYDNLKQAILEHEGAQLMQAHPSVTQVAINNEFVVCFIPNESHEAYPSIACRRVDIDNGDIIVQTTGWNANPDNTDFQPWLGLFDKQDQEIRAEIIESTRSNDE